MGLDTSHNAWHGPYSAFSRWRNTLCQAAGWELEKFRPNLDSAFTYEWPKQINQSVLTAEHVAGKWANTPEDPLILLIAHSDCHGKIYPRDAGPLADRLEQLLPALPDGSGGGHIWDAREVTQRFIDGLRLAAGRDETVEFH